MAECPIPQSEQDFNENFEQIKPLMNRTEAYYESSRCLFCYNAPCTEACPTKIDIPLFIRQINTGNIVGAAKTIYSSNYFGGVCGKVCPTEVLCEGACVLNNQKVKPIEIGRLQYHAVAQAIASRARLFGVPEPGEKKVAVIGAGPAGISCACELRLSGVSVDIFEAEQFPSGLALFGIAPYKITNEEVLEEMEYLSSLFGFSIHYSRLIGGGDLENLEKSYDAVFLGIGLGDTLSTSLPGETLPGCVGATEFIKDLKLQKQNIKVPKTVVVLGGGNTAMDAASEAARLGAENVVLAYRRSKQEKRAYEFEYDLAKNVGVKGLFNAAPLEILGSGNVEGVRFIRTRSKEGKINNLPGSEFTVTCDMVIRATGQEKKVKFLKGIQNLTVDDGGRIIIHENTFQTGNPLYFAGGDAISGGAEVVNAAAEGKQAAQGILAYLSVGGNNA